MDTNIIDATVVIKSIEYTMNSINKGKRYFVMRALTETCDLSIVSVGTYATSFGDIHHLDVRFAKMISEGSRDAFDDNYFVSPSGNEKTCPLASKEITVSEYEILNDCGVSSYCSLPTVEDCCICELS